MEVLKDYPKEFAKLFQPSFNFLSKINMKFCSESEGFFRSYWRFLYVIPCLVAHYVTLGLNVCKLAAQGEIFEVAYLLPPFLISTQVIIKTIVLAPKISSISTVIRELGSLWRTEGLSEIQNEKRNALLKKINLCNRVTYWLTIFGSSQYLMTPLVETLVRKLILKQDCGLLLPMECNYPFDPTANWLVFGTVYAFQLYTMYMCVFMYVGSEMIVITLCGILGLEFTLLCEDILNIKPVCNKIRVNKNISDNEGSAEGSTINGLVMRHQKLCLLSTQLDEAFNQMIFIDLLFVGITTCFFRYAAQFSRGPTYMMNNYTAVFTSLLNVLYLCYYGELLTGASFRIGEMAYHNLWYKGDIQYQKSICIIILRSQKPCCLTSMKYAPITLNMFTKVISTTWSYLSLMNTVYEQEN